MLYASTLTLNRISEEERLRRTIQTQRGRIKIILTLSGMSAVEFATIIMSYYCTIPFWLIVVNIACIMFNFPLIYWLCHLYIERNKLEKERRNKSMSNLLMR